MSKAVSSPTGRLLRSSRLFSLPRPLPAPQLEKPSAQGQYRASDTATLPYPTHQAISTPASSNYRGDWGLKRPLPAKSTRRTSTPVIRVHKQDTYEHITDFASAADHVLNERKWAEMGVPMTHRARGHFSHSRPNSAYEDWLDNTDIASTTERSIGEAGEPNANENAPWTGGRARAQDSPELQAVRHRWKSAGPWIAGLQQTEFQTWLDKMLAENKASGAWTQFIADHYAEKRFVDAQRRARDDGDVIGREEAERLKALLRPSPSECVEITRTLREEHEVRGLSSDLTALLCEFLDIPSIKPTQSEAGTTSTADLASRLSSGNSDRGPPSTHPGAGLSYIRTGAFLENHPVHGPQARRSPVLARVLRTRSSSQGGQLHQARLGVGGFVAQDQASSTFNPVRNMRETQRNTDDALTQFLDPDMEGGNKIWVHPESASVDESGRLDFVVTRGDREAVAVKTGDVSAIYEMKAAGNSAVSMPTLTGFGSGRTTRLHNRAAPAAGVRLPGVAAVEGFDNALPRGNGDQMSAVGKIRNILDHGS